MKDKKVWYIKNMNNFVKSIHGNGYSLHETGVYTIRLIFLSNLFLALMKYLRHGLVLYPREGNLFHHYGILL